MIQMRNVKCFIVILLLVLCWKPVSGQRVSVSTNLLEYLNLATLNADVSYAVSRHWSVGAAVKYNPWTFNSARVGKQFQNRQQCYSAAGRYWLWHTYSGWWFSGKLQYQEYNSGGLLDRSTEEGDRFGAGLSAGYTYMLHPRLNIEFGIGLWGGYRKYKVYSCPACGVTESAGAGAFVLPDDIRISLAYVF